MEITTKDLMHLKPISNSRHKGQFGSCYMFDGRVLKIIDKLDSILIPIGLEERLECLTKFKIEGVALPLELVYYNHQFIGYTMPHYNGKNLSMILLKYELNNQIPSIDSIDMYFDTLIRKIDILTNNHIKVNDIKSDNIIVYNNELNLVDCDFYKYDSDVKTEDLLKQNLEEVKKGISKLPLQKKKDTYKFLIKKIKNR